MLESMTEPWLRGTLSEVPAVARAVLHALQLAEEDLEKWCGTLSEAELFARPLGLPAVAFHLRHIARSLDRLLTYAEGHQLNDMQLAALRSEPDGSGTRDEISAELRSALARSAERVQALDVTQLESPRAVGKKSLPSTLGGLLVHGGRSHAEARGPGGNDGESGDRGAHLTSPSSNENMLISRRA